MKTLEKEMQIFEKILTMIEKHFGPDTEIVLHDLTKPYEHTIIDIRNGNVTGRKIGDCGSNLGLEVLKGKVKDGDRFNYVTYLKDNKIIRSSSIYLYNDKNKVIGSICINTDITELVKFEKYLKQNNKFDLDEEMAKQDTVEFFVNDVQELLEKLCMQGQRLIGKPAAIMDREEKINFLKFLDEKGAFLITRSSEKVCQFLSISKFTLYKYLEGIRGNGTNGINNKTEEEK